LTVANRTRLREQAKRLEEQLRQITTLYNRSLLSKYFADNDVPQGLRESLIEHAEKMGQRRQLLKESDIERLIEAEMRERTEVIDRLFGGR